MEFPVLLPVPVRRSVIDSFGGYCHGDHVEAGQFFDMENMSGDRFPYLSPRGGRGALSARNPELWNPGENPPLAMAELDGLCLLTQEGLYYDLRSGLFHKEELALSAELPKSLVSFGSYLIILPDGKYLNLRHPEDQGSLEAIYAPEKPDVQFYLCSRDGKILSATAATTAPAEPADGTLWLDISRFYSRGKSPLLQYSLAEEHWVSLADPCIRVEATGIGAAFSAGDWVFTEGVEDHALCALTAQPREVVLAAADYLVLDAPMGSDAVTLEGAEGFAVARRLPKMDFLFASGDRLWGCRYGWDEGRFVNEIYASKQGDFKNWYCFRGEDSDSVCIPCGTDGPWTGVIHALGQPLLFKENCLHRIYGDSAKNFRMQTLPCQGVQEGCHKSLAVIHGMLYYKALCGVVCFDGALPEPVSQALGGEPYFAAVAGALGDKYYISMLDSHGESQLFCYDTGHKFWHRQDQLRVMELRRVKDKLYYIEAGSNVVGILDGGDSVERKFPWFAESGRLQNEGAQYLRRITVRLSMAPETALRFLVEYDSEGLWRPLAQVTGGRRGTVSLALRLRRCDHLRLRIEGEGPALIYSLSLERTPGGGEAG